MRRTLMLLALVCAVAAPAAASGVRITIPVPTVTVQPGDVLTEDMVAERQVVASEAAVRMHHTSRDSVVGKVARRTLPANAAIAVNALREPYVFKDGDRIVILFGEGGLSIQATGVAMQPGVLGEAIRVRNLDTGVVVRGIVQGDGSVRVSGG